ncbi:putative asparagine synthetase [glutamine-hydrolyzing] [bacterium BMS3Abin03]|nr:putative asparagine synthetase [glutamine-hydrolyzing] [bacterium BMS3Abin03]
MPGISLIYNNNGLPREAEEITTIINNLNILDHHSSQIFKCEQNFFMGWNKYEEYPIQIIDHNHFTIIIEGKIYNKDNEKLKTEIIELADGISQNNYSIKISDWLKNTDGDFIIYIINDNNIYILNDIFGRLPLYYSISENGIILSRYLRFIKDINKDFAFNRIAISQFLLLGYMLGKHTILENVYHLRPGSLIKIESSKVNVEVIHEFNFEYKKYRERNFEENINNLSNLFSEAAINRLQGAAKNIVAMSGGLDSRAIAACLNKHNSPFIAVTMKYKTGYTEEEVVVAEQVAALLNLDWKLLDVVPPNGDDIYKLLKIKEGMNSLYMAGIIPFYKEIQKSFGNNINFFTGDNGDKLIFTIDRPITNFKNVDELVEYIISEHAIIPIDEVVALTKTKKTELFNDLKELVLSFPENDLKQKYIHFRIHEKPFKYAYQGEDRHRNYFWSVSPFWSIQFFNYIMNCSDESKIRHKTFRRLLQSYSPEVTDLNYTNIKSSITSFKGKFSLFVIYYIYPRIPVLIKRKLKSTFFEGNPSTSEDSTIFKCIKDIVNNSKMIKEYFKVENSSDLRRYRKKAIYNILTMLSIIEELGEGKSTLSKYLNEEFH